MFGRGEFECGLAAFPIEAYVVAVNPLREEDGLECALSGTSFFKTRDERSLYSCYRVTYGIDVGISARRCVATASQFPCPESASLALKGLHGLT